MPAMVNQIKNQKIKSPDPALTGPRSRPPHQRCRPHAATGFVYRWSKMLVFGRDARCCLDLATTGAHHGEEGPVPWEVVWRHGEGVRVAAMEKESCCAPCVVVRSVAPW
jgi:hypothetical protein